MPKESSVEKQIQRLTKRLEKIEKALESAKFGRSGHDYDSTDSSDHLLGSCRLPDVPERHFGPDVSPFRARLIRYFSKKWVNGTRLKYYFFTNDEFGGEPGNVTLVREGFQAWKDLGIGLEFEEVQAIDDAEVRIGFKRGDGSWSYVGRDVIDIPGQYERTMNFGWDLTQDPRGGGLDTPIHEIGHTLGFPHEHQNPFSGIVWDEEAVYQYFAGSPNFWPRSTTYHNVLRKLDPSEVEGSEWDPDSIMHYGFAGGLIVEPEQYRNGLDPEDGLSQSDIDQARRFYPTLTPSDYATLEYLKLEPLALNPGEQKNFIIEPRFSGEHTIQTFGRSDTVVVLFEDVNGNHVYIDGDDDSGTNLNSKVTARLVKGRKYILRIRLYLNYASGSSAVLMY